MLVRASVTGAACQEVSFIMPTERSSSRSAFLGEAASTQSCPSACLHHLPHHWYQYYLLNSTQHMELITANPFGEPWQHSSEMHTHQTFIPSGTVLLHQSSYGPSSAHQRL